MKARKILFATVCSALFFSSCGNEDEPIAGGFDKQFTVKLKTDFDLVATRATAPSSGNENVIPNSKVLLYNGTGNLIGSKDITNPLTAGNITVTLQGGAATGDVRSVYVLGNLTATGNDNFKLSTADFNSKSDVDNANITVTVAGMKNESAYLPFAGGANSVSGGAATVNLKRKAARLRINNQTGQAISYGITNVSTSFSGLMDAAKVTDDAPGATANIGATTIAADKASQNLYLLPNTSTTNAPVLTITVGTDNKTVNLSLEANKAYTYTVTKTTSSDVTVTVTIDSDWSNLQEGNVNFGGSEVVAEVASRAYTATAVLPDAVTSTDGLTATATNFSVSFAAGSGANAGKVVATLTPNRPFVTAAISEKISVMKAGSVVATVAASQKAWEFKEVRIGNKTFMDRDLGAMSAEEPIGEIFALGSLIPVDQSEANVTAAPLKANFSGNGRITREQYNALSFSASVPWFTVDGSKNSATDPCPQGWHISTLNELELIFTAGHNTSSGNTDGQGVTSGALAGTLTYEPANRKLTVTKVDSDSNFTIKFSGNGAHLSINGWTGNTLSWPVGWWTSTKTTANDRYYNLAFNFTETIAQPLRAQLRPNNTLNSSGRRGLLIRCVKD